MNVYGFDLIYQSYYIKDIFTIQLVIKASKWFDNKWFDFLPNEIENVGETERIILVKQTQNHKQYDDFCLLQIHIPWILKCLVR